MAGPYVVDYETRFLLNLIWSIYLTCLLNKTLPWMAVDTVSLYVSALAEFSENFALCFLLKQNSTAYIAYSGELLV